MVFKNNSNDTLLLFFCLVFLLGGCASYKLDEAQHNIRSSFATQNFDQTIELLKNYEKKEIYKIKDNVLLELELGTVNHFNQQYDSSTIHFERAEEKIDQLYTKSISRGLASFLITNDNALAYDGEDYEDIYLNTFKSLNFIHLNNLEGALVEARRMAFKLSQLKIKYEGLAEALARADTLEETEWKTGKSNIQNSAFSHYLAGILYAKSGKPDDARIEYERMLEAIREQPKLYHFRQTDEKSLQRIKNPAQFNVLITAFAGRAPIKRQHDIRTYVPSRDLYLKFSVPSLNLYPSQVRSVEVIFNDTLRTSVNLMEEMDLVSREMYKIKEPIIYARAFARSLLKALGSNAISNKLKEKKENSDENGKDDKKGLGILAGIFGKVGQEVSEKADLRSWQTMPGKVYANTVKLPAGEHHAVIQYYDADGRILYNREKKLTISQNSSLELIETLYWN